MSNPPSRESPVPGTWVPPRPPLPAATRTTAGSIVVRVVLGGYALLLTLVAFWPTPVDAQLGRVLNAITRIVPVLTHPRIEFLANVALFLPLGVLLAIVLVRSRYLVLPIVFVTTFTIECVQGLLLPERTPSVMDMIANTAGGCVGLLAVAAVEALHARRR